MSLRCAAHEGREAGFRCASCRRALCEECVPHVLREDRFCAPCVDAIRKTSPLVRPLFTAGFFAAGAVPLAAFASGDATAGSFAFIAYAILGIATVLLSYRAARRLELDFDPDRRSVEAPARAIPPATSTYRSAPRRLEERVRALEPPISASWATLIVGAALAFPALVVPALASLPRWLEVEAVLALWWLAAALGLGHLLFHGTVAADDDRLEDRGRLPDPWPLDFGEGCASAISRRLAALGLLLLFAWLLAELVFPALFLGAYATLAMLLRAATRDRHDCRGHFGRSLLWGAIWATIYTVPLAIVVALVHLVLATR